eukprot:2913519-Lingulodinium_polyedra.AAC.2
MRPGARGRLLSKLARPVLGCPPPRPRTPRTRSSHHHRSRRPRPQTSRETCDLSWGSVVGVLAPTGCRNACVPKLLWGTQFCLAPGACTPGVAASAPDMPPGMARTMGKGCTKGRAAPSRTSRTPHSCAHGRPSASQGAWVSK